MAEVDTLYSMRPSWAASMVSQRDARYLYTRALASGTNIAVEIGTASGVSAAVLCAALAHSHAHGRIGSDFGVMSYDIKAQFHGDPSRKVGDAVHEMLPPELASRIEFRNPATSMSLRQYHRHDSIGLLFIDADHKHPWPALDLLAVTDLLEPGAEVILHDISLPIRKPRHQEWGAKFLFDDLDVEKFADPAGDSEDLANVGSIFVPDDKAAFREQIINLADSHEWETRVPAGLMALLDACSGNAPRAARFRPMSNTQVNRLNWGCGASGEPGWLNSDIKEGPGIDLPADITKGLPLDDDSIDYAVSIHGLPELHFDLQVPTLRELRRVLKPGGTLRLGLPDLEKGMNAYRRDDRDYFLIPDEDMESLGGKLITQLVWYGYSRTLFVPEFIEELLHKAGFEEVAHVAYKETASVHSGITELDNRENESLFVEATK